MSLKKSKPIKKEPSGKNRLTHAFYDSLAPKQKSILDKEDILDKQNLLIILWKYVNGKASQWEERKLREKGLINTPASGEKEESDNDICETQDELRNRIMIHYKKDGISLLLREITKQEISDWTKSKRLHGAPSPPKPIVGARPRWSLRAWLEWFEMHKRWTDEFKRDDTKHGIADGLRVVPMGELREIKEREQIEHERWRMVKEMGGYVSVPMAERHAAGFSRRYHEQWKTRNEKTMIEAFEVKAQALNVPPEIIAALKDFLVLEHQKFTDAVEVASEKFASELVEKLKAENKQEAKI